MTSELPSYIYLIFPGAIIYVCIYIYIYIYIYINSFEQTTDLISHC